MDFGDAPTEAYGNCWDVQTAVAPPEPEWLLKWYTSQCNQLRTRRNAPRPIHGEDYVPAEYVRFYSLSNPSVQLRDPARNYACYAADAALQVFWHWSSEYKLLYIFGGIHAAYIIDCQVAGLQLRTSTMSKLVSIGEILVRTPVAPVDRWETLLPPPLPAPTNPIRACGYSDPQAYGLCKKKAANDATLQPPSGNIEWIRKRSPTSDAYYLVDDNDRRKDRLTDSFTFAEVDYYVDYVTRMLLATELILHTQRQAKFDAGSMAKTSPPLARELIESYLLEPDLTDPLEREKDYRGRLLVLFLSVGLELKLRSKKNAGDTSETFMDVALRGLQRSLALQFDLRHRHIFRAEKDVMNLLRLNGTQEMFVGNAYTTLRNPAVVGAAVFPAASERPASSASYASVEGYDVEKPLTIEAPNATDDKRKIAVPMRTGKDHPFLAPVSSGAAPPVQSLNGYSREEEFESRTELVRKARAYLLSGEANCCIRCNDRGKKPLYLLLEEPLSVARERCESDELDHYFLSPICKSSYAAAEELGSVRHVIVENMPVVFYTLVRREVVDNQQALTTYLRAIDENVRRPCKEGDSMIEGWRDAALYCAKASGEFTAADVTILGMPTYKELCMIIIEGIVMKDVSALNLLVVLTNAALRRQGALDVASGFYPGVAVTTHMKEEKKALYNAGYLMPAEFATTFRGEFHPGKAHFEIAMVRSIARYRERIVPHSIYEMPLVLDEQKHWMATELRRFIADNRGAALPEYCILVPSEELSHSFLLSSSHTTGDSVSEVCSYISKLTSKASCSTCPRDRVMRIGEGSAAQEYVWLNYREVAAWQYSLFMSAGKRLIADLDAKAKGAATFEFFNDYLEKTVGMGAMWRSLSNAFNSTLSLLSGKHVETCIDYRAISSSGKSLDGKYRYFDDETQRKILEYVAINPQPFYEQFLGAPDRVFSTSLRWGDSGSMTVFLTKGKKDEDLPGSYKRWSGSGSSGGNAFWFVVNEVFHSDGRHFGDAVRRVLEWVLNTFGLDALTKDPPKKEVLEVSSGPSNGGARPLAHKDDYSDARSMWRDAIPLSREHARKGCTAAVLYLKDTRCITDERIIFHPRYARFVPTFAVGGEAGGSVSYPAIVFPSVDPLDPQRKIVGLQGICLDHRHRKVVLSGGSKRNRGNIGDGAAEIWKPAGDTDAVLLFNGATIAIAEGPETASSVAMACPELWVWSSLGIQNTSGFPYLGPRKWGEGIILCADNDAGDSLDDRLVAEKRKGILKHVPALTAKGYKVLVCWPKHISRPGAKGTDFNDILVHVKPPSDALRVIRETLMDLSSIRIFAPTSPDPDATQPVRLENGTIAPMRKRQNGGKAALEELRKKHATEKTKAKAESGSSSSDSESSSSDSSSSSDASEEKPKKAKVAPKPPASPPRRPTPKEESSSSSSSSSSESSSDSEEEAKSTTTKGDTSIPLPVAQTEKAEDDDLDIADENPKGHKKTIIED